MTSQPSQAGLLLIGQATRRRLPVLPQVTGPQQAGSGECKCNCFLLTVDKISHLHRPGVLLADRRADAADHLGGVLPLRAEPAARVGVRRPDHDVRHAVHDGGRLHAREEQPRARRRALRLLPAAHAGRVDLIAVHRCSSSRASSRSSGPAGPMPHESWAISEHRPSRPNGCRSIRSSRDSGRRRVAADAGHRRDHPLHHLPARGRVAEPRGGRRGGGRRQAEADGPREGRGHPGSRPGVVAHEQPEHANEDRKELWFGLRSWRSSSILVLVLHACCPRRRSRAATWAC